MYIIGVYCCIIDCNKRLLKVCSHKKGIGSYVEITLARPSIVRDIMAYIYIFRVVFLMWQSNINHKIESNFWNKRAIKGQWFNPHEYRYVAIITRDNHHHMHSEFEISIDQISSLLDLIFQCCHISTMTSKLHAYWTVLVNNSFMLTTQKMAILLAPCEGNPPVTSDFTGNRSGMCNGFSYRTVIMWYLDDVLSIFHHLFIELLVINAPSYSSNK